MVMRYDKHGFPIPPRFEGRVVEDADEFSRPLPGRAARPGGPGRGSRKPWVILALLAVIVPAVVAPAVRPAVREFVVHWSLEQARDREADRDIPGAIRALGRAIHWHGRDDAGLLCERAMLRLEDRDTAGALADVERAAAAATAAVQPWRVKALVHAAREEADAAASAADTVVELSAPGDPEALNHRAYIKALVGRDLPGALADIDRAVSGTTEPSPALLDTRGYILHLVGRHQEAIDQLNVAINGLQRMQRQFKNLRGRVDDRAGLECRLRRLEHEWAVMLHHRGLACRAVGLEEQAKQDLELAQRKGFDPSRGIF
jgi:hypothetical protein